MEVYDIPVMSCFADLLRALDDPSVDSISWSKSNRSFIIWNPKELQAQLPVKYSLIAWPTFSQFVVMLNDFGFKRIKGTEHSLEFGHDKYLVREKPHLLKYLLKEYKRQKMRTILQEQKAKEMKSVADGLQKMQI